MKKLKNSLELTNPTRNTHKFANELMADTCGEINLQSKQDVICHVEKKKNLQRQYIILYIYI